MGWVDSRGEIRKSQKPKRFYLFALPWIGILTIILLTSCSQLSTLNPAGPAARQTAALTWWMFAIAGLVFLVVLVLLGMVARRARPSLDVGEPLPAAGVTDSDRQPVRLVLLGGALAPAVVLLVIMSFSIYMDNVKAANGSFTIEVVGRQWWWEVRYPDQSVVTANEIHIPVGTPVSVQLSSADVIHSFWVPELGGKLDTIPGQTNTFILEADQAGVYRGQCAEYCGLQHANMAFYVIAQEPADFRTWLEAQSRPAAEVEVGSPLNEGRQAFLSLACVSCHTIRGTDAAGTLGPDLTHLASRSTIGAGSLPNDRANLVDWITNSHAIKPGNKMPPMPLASDQMQALVEYLDSLE